MDLTRMAGHNNNAAGGNHDGLANGASFGDSSQQFLAYDNLNLFPHGTDPTFNDAGWGLNASDYDHARGQHAVPSWQQNANHLSAPTAHAAFNNGRTSPYGRSLNHSPAAHAQNTQPAQSAFNGFGTPQDFAYRQLQYAPSPANQPASGQHYGLNVHGFNPPEANGGTITPQALERDTQIPSTSKNPYGANGFAPNYGQTPQHRPAIGAPQLRPVDQRALMASIPKAATTGMFSIIDFDGLARASKSVRLGNYVNVGKDALEWDCTRSAIPTYNARRSRNDIRAAANGNAAVLAKVGKKSSKAKTSALNNAKAMATSASSTAQIKYEEESSSSGESSDDESSYSASDDDSDTPLPAKRPDTPKAAVEYDTIKALWRSKRKSVPGDVIRKSLVDFWELVKTIRDRWKADAAAVTEAEDKKRTGELPLLHSRVKDQRDMIETAFKAVLKHGHRIIVEFFAENLSLLFLCYQFLLDRCKADDLNGGLSSAILETMSIFTTLTKEKIDKTHLVKVLPRLYKKGNAKTQYWVKKINGNAEAATKDAATKTGLEKTDKAAASGTNTNPASPARKTSSDPVVGVKRAATTTPGDGTAPKKVLTGTNKPSGTAVTKVNGVVKKPASGNDTAKTSSTALPITVRKTAVAKPSGFFSNLQSAAKKPGTTIADKATPNSRPSASKLAGTNTPAPKPAFSFAETMANLSKPKEEKPVPKPEKAARAETEEQRSKRLRREQRRNLRVQFKPQEHLVEIRYFTHDPDEETDHDSSQMRDVADVGGEGRMFKQQSQMMDIDDEDDGADEVEELKPHNAPSLIDFSVVEGEERKRNYAPYGGGLLEVESQERSVRDEYESHNLIVFYTERSQIPPDPREPTDPYSGELGSSLKYFAVPEEKYAARARERKGQQSTAGPLPGQPFYQPPALGATSNADISSILASLRQQGPSQPPSATPAYNQAYMGVQNGAGFQPPTAPVSQAPPANIDLAAILASLNPGQGNFGAAGAAPMMSFVPQPQTGTAGAGEVDIAGIMAANPFYKTKVCRFWQEGRCQKGESCSYVHE